MIRRLGLGLAMALVLGGTAWASQPLVSPGWLMRHLSDRHVVVVDIRPSAQNAKGHIPGAVAADYAKAGWRVKQADGAVGALPPVNQIAATIGALGIGDKDTAVIVSDDFPAAARVYWTFKVLGHNNVSLLDGGWTAWTKAHGNVATAPVSRAKAVFTPHYNPSIRAELAEVTTDVSTGAETLVDARPLAAYEGKTSSPIVKTAGHIPGAISIDQRQALTDGGTKLKPKAELAALFEKTGDKPVVSYCGTGHAAAADWFVLSEVLHHKQAKMYDGSMSQWTADPTRPVER